MFSFATTPPSGVTRSDAATVFSASLALTVAASPAIAFEPNLGQTDSAVRYLARGGGTVFYFTPRGVLLERAPARLASTASRCPACNRIERSMISEAGATPLAVSRTQIQFVGTGRTATISTGAALPGRVNYFVGSDPAHWQTDVPRYSDITYSALYPGIDLSYAATAGALKSTYTVQPGANPKLIRWRYDVAGIPTVNASGDLLVAATSGDSAEPQSSAAITEHVPVAWQVVGTQRHTVPVHFEVGGDGTVGFVIGEYDHSRALIIDPTLTLSTYLGGSGDDQGIGVATDSLGNVYVTGKTTSVNFPLSQPYQGSDAGEATAFVSKLTPTGSLVYSTYLGGTGTNGAEGNGIAVDKYGNAYVTGYTTSTDFPVVNPAQGMNHASGFANAFVTKLNPQGSGLVYSTYLGGSTHTKSGDYGVAVAVDTAGDAYITGATDSLDFPTAGSPLQGVIGGGVDAFVTKLSSDGSFFVYSTYLGGIGTDAGQAIAVDAAGNAYVTGVTYSINFPTSNPYQAFLNGSAMAAATDNNPDAFVCKLSPSGSALVYSTFLGGTGAEFGLGVAIDASGAAFVTGYTTSDDFPTTAGTFQPSHPGVYSAFVTKFRPDGTATAYSTYLGGTGRLDLVYGNGIAIDSLGDAFIVGAANAVAFPTVRPIQPSGHGDYDAFVTELNPSASGLVYSTYLGGRGYDSAQAIALAADGSAYVTGLTASTDFPVTQGLQQSYGGGPYDAFLVRITDVALAPTNVVSRKTHGTAGNFDIDLPFTGARGVECRSGGVTNDYTLVFTFVNNLTSVGSASVTSHNPASGTGTVSSSAMGPNPNQYTVNLTNVSTGQYITVTLNSVVDVAGNSGNIVSPQMGVLIGDVNATGLVDGNDVSLVQGQARQNANSTNFRLDVNTTGLIDGNDVSLTQSHTRTSLPSPP